MVRPLRGRTSHVRRCCTLQTSSRVFGMLNKTYFAPFGSRHICDSTTNFNEKLIHNFRLQCCCKLSEFSSADDQPSHAALLLNWMRRKMRPTDIVGTRRRDQDKIDCHCRATKQESPVIVVLRSMLNNTAEYI